MCWSWSCLKSQITVKDANPPKKMVEPEYIPPDLKSNVVLYRVSGMWPPLKRSYLYPLLSIAILLIIGIGYPFSQLMNIVFIDSIDIITDQCLISSTVVAGTVKGVNIYLQQSKLRKIFQLHKEMSEKWARGTDVREHFKTIAKNNVRILNLFIWMYMAGGTGVALQTIFSTPEKRLYASTYYVPFEFGKNPAVYFSVIVFQVICSFFYCFWNAIEDTYPVILILILCGHLDTLQTQLANLGVKEDAADTGIGRDRLSRKYYTELGNCVSYYQSCLRLVIPV